MSTTPQAAQVPAPGQSSWRAAYDSRVAGLKAQYDAIPPGSPVRLAKSTSNLFRQRAESDVPGLDVADFDGV
ncbi:MAG: hypothetical protein ACO21N_11220, partial [Candidatus Nanopelagicales bacterium]